MVQTFLSINSALCPSRLPLMLSLRHHPLHRLHSAHLVSGRPFRQFSSCSRLISVGQSRFRRGCISASAAPEGTVSVINFEELMEKDWSFLEMDDLDSDAAHKQNIDRIVSAGKVEPTSKVMVSFGSEGFVDKLFEPSQCQPLLVVHDSLFVLAGIKEKYDDKVKCWQGELIYVPEKWTPLDVVFIYFLPAMPFTLDQIFGALSQICLPGARVVISHPGGRQVLQQQRKEFPEAVISDLPDKRTLDKVAADHSFTLAEYTDEAKLYLAVLNFKEA